MRRHLKMFDDCTTHRVVLLSLGLELIQCEASFSLYGDTNKVC